MTESADILPPLKRPRVETSATADVPQTNVSRVVEEAERDEEFWLEDGNIILVTTARPTAFRIYKVLLTRQIELFADMFASSTPSEGDAPSYSSLTLLKTSGTF